MNYYVYCRNIATGIDADCGIFVNAKEAIECITGLYNMDRNLNQLGEYYYYMRLH